VSARIPNDLVLGYDLEIRLGKKEKGKALSRSNRGEGTRPRARREPSGREDCRGKNEEAEEAQEDAVETARGKRMIETE
jgi:hypothetical protein